MTSTHGDVTDVATIRRLDQHTGFDRLWQPYIAQWSPDGLQEPNAQEAQGALATPVEKHHLVVAFGGHLAGKVDMGSILSSVSVDGGTTWSDPVAIFDHLAPLGPLRFAYANPVLYRPPGQPIIWCYAMRCPLHYRDSEDSRLAAAYSTDGGRSWVQVEPSVDFHSPLIIVAGVAAVPVAGTGGGEGAGGTQTRYLLPAHRNGLRHDPRGDRQHFILESTSLIEWRFAAYIPQEGEGPRGKSPRVFLHEGNIAPGDGDGELKIVMRTADYEMYTALNPPVAYSSTSADGGRTWSPAQPEADLHNTVSKAFFGRDARGRHVYVYSAGPQRERGPLHYKTKPPGEPWSASRIFFDLGVKNSYPTLIEYAPGEFHAVWDSSDSPDRHRTCIRYGRLSLNR